jgi:hypothetical protein
VFFELHDERKIGYKILSAADLGIGTSHQTHIGLSEYLLTFLSDRDVKAEDSVLIYEGLFTFLDANFDRILNPNGTYRSPKIRTGERQMVSIVSTIRETTRQDSSNSRWYLLWFGLTNEKLVFFLVKENSADYNYIINAGLDLNKKRMGVIHDGYMFRSLVQYIETRINTNATDVLKELEIKTQIELLKPDKRFRKYDIERANAVFKETGRKGEFLVAKFLERKVNSGEIMSFTWHNEKQESALPYDFTIQDNGCNLSQLDVKTTGYDFAQKMIFSNQEIEYITVTDNGYLIYRVYKTAEDEYKLRICDDCKTLSIQLNHLTITYKDGLNRLQAELQNAKIAIPPNIDSLTFKAEIALDA